MEQRTISTIRAGIIGATGTTGVELASTLYNHPQVELAFATSRSMAGHSLNEMDPAAPPVLLTKIDDVDIAAADVVFLCLPHGSSAPTAQWVHEKGPKVIDLSGDLRLADTETHQKVYGTDRSEDLARQTVYGMPELCRKKIASARVVANPGCYATAVALALIPLAETGRIREPVYVDAKSGVSGAGRAATATTHYCSVNEDIRPYKIGRAHRHIPEIEQTLDVASSGAGPDIVFVPHLVPLERGIIATCVARNTGIDAGQAQSLYAERYANEPFVRVLPNGESARIRTAAHSNRAAISITHVEEFDWLIITSAIDNLGKGAAGQAVQNMNLMMGLPETTGLRGF